MTREEFEVQKMITTTGFEWRPIKDNVIETGFLISCTGQVYNYKLKKALLPDKQNYIRMRYKGKQYFRQIKELMLNTFPELYPDNPNDEWKTIEISGEDTAYEISQRGEVRRRNNHRLVKPVLNSNGYFLIRLRHKGKTITNSLHRLVAIAFIPNPNGLEEVNHIDENRQNNAISNLEWCDRHYNYYYHEASKRAQFHSKLTQKLQKLSKMGNGAAASILKTPKYYNNAELLETALKLVSE